MYQLTQYESVLKLDGDALMCIPNDPANTDWQIYQAWLAADPENNVPLPAA